MCGIVGIFNYSGNEKVNPDLLIKMRDEMIHRGPDDAGLWLSENGFVGLAHRRLSIIDLSEKARQPMSNEDNTIWIVYNGEIYNHQEIRNELINKGHIFKTDHSDTEVIIHAYEEWNIKCVEKFRGMFAFCIWDDKNKELLLFRDRIGIKPVYYINENGRFIFASEIKSILIDRTISREVDLISFYNYLSFLTVPPPNTMFNKINKLPSGSYLKISSNGSMNAKRYWDVLDNINPVEMPEELIYEKLLEELKISVQYRKISDVPVGIFLSGGMDSSINAALFSMNSKERIKTFTIGYEGENQTYENEFKYARMVANLLGAEYHEKSLKIDDLINFLNKLVFFQDEPISDPVCFPIYFVSKLARENGVTVCQVGEGSDELFLGYPGWKTALKLENLNSIRFTGFIKKILLNLLKISNRGNTYSYEWLSRAIKGQPIFWGGAEAFFENEKKSLLSENLKNQFKDYSSFEVIKPIFDRFNEKAWEKTPLNWMSYLDLNFRLPELLLMRVDKMSMAVSLEVRVPFLDHKFVEFIMSISERVKIGNGELKHLLKKSVKGLLPDEIIYRKKQGFGVPLYEWFLSELGDFAKDKILKFLQKTDFFNKNHIDLLFKAKNSHKIWYILNFVLWYEKWIEKIN